MPTLNWIGKDKVINHHQDVPFRVLDHQYGYTPDGKQEAPVNSGNLIIHGDNLEALKSLLPQYEAKVKCIYIDPPYNTGNEGWAYNDNVTDPKIKKWLHQVVGKEGEDLSRHDKWLCMMYPRLVLLQKLLSQDGAIFISIDDNEQAMLKLVCDEIFGRGCFVGDIVWRSADSSNNDAKQLSVDHNHTLLYSKRPGWTSTPLDRNEESNAHYNNPDDDPRGPWFSGNVSSPNPRKNLRYELTTPNGNTIAPPANGWRWQRERMLSMIQTGEVIFTKDNQRIVKKTYLADQKGLAPSSLWADINETGHNRNAKYELKKIFPELTTSDLFKTPKPEKFINKILRISTDSTDIILDSFAGSGTTAHAVLNLNKLDGGNRKFILVEMEDYAETITAERVKRVINGYADVEGTGGSFDYYELGPRLFDESGNLNEQVPVSRIREYIWYSETRSAFNALTEDQLCNPYFLGIKEDTGYYFYYEPQQVTTLDYDFLGTISLKAEQYVVYADNCLLSKTFLQNNNIIFKKIPRDISRL